MQTREEFYSKLERLQHRFDAMKPELEVTVRDKKLNVEGHIVVWNTSISLDGPLPYCAKGGTRIRQGLNRDEVKMLARNMAIKNAAAGLPLGGCKSGLNADSRQKNFEPVYRRFIELCKPFTYENGGIFGGFGFDVGASPEHAIWACETLKSTKSFTGKTVAMGGTDYDREGIAGLGVAESAKEILRLHNEKVTDIRYAVHGAGAMGSAVIRYFSDSGAHLYCLGDPKFGGTWKFESSISEALLRALAKQDTETARQLIAEEGQHVSDNPNEVLFADCDVLFPCALQHVISPDNVDRIKARYVVEGANNPTTLNAYTPIYQKGIHHIPDFIANAGGVIAAYVELTSHISDEENTRTRGKVNEAKILTGSTIKHNIDCIVNLSERHRVPLRDAGLLIALEAVLKNEVAAKEGIH